MNQEDLNDLEIVEPMGCHMCVAGDTMIQDRGYNFKKMDCLWKNEGIERLLKLDEGCKKGDLGDIRVLSAEFIPII